MEQIVHTPWSSRYIGIAIQHRSEDLDRRFAREQPLAGQDLVENDAERPDVGPLVRRLALGLLGSHGAH